jgi:hypothetical protein
MILNDYRTLTSKNLALDNRLRAYLNDNQVSIDFFGNLAIGTAAI